MPISFARLLLAVFALFSTVNGLQAQFFDELDDVPAERTEQPDEPVDFEAEAPQVPVEDDRVLIPELKGLVFFERTEEKDSIDTKELMYFDKIAVVDFDLFDNAEFRLRLQHHFNKEVTFQGLQEISKTVNRYAAAIGRPVVKVSLPPQDITEGIVQFGLTEGRLSKLTVTGAEHFNSKRIAKQFKIKPGEPIDFPQLQKDINWISSNRFIKVSPVVGPGEGFGATDIEVAVEDRLPVAVNASIDSSGSRSTDLIRYNLGGDVGNLWWLGHRANFNFSTNGQTSEFRSYSGSYVIPLPWRHEFHTVGGYSRTISNSPTNPVKGTSWQLAGRYFIPPHRWKGWTRSLNASAQISSNDSDFFLGGLALPLGTTEAVQGSLGINMSRSDRYWDGTTSFSLNVTGGDGSTENAGKLIPLDTYFYTNFNARRRWALYNDWSMLTEFDMQWATDTLPTLESFGLGGARSVRGFDQRIISGDSGWRVRAELRTPSTRALSRFSWMNQPDALQCRLFYDYGVAIDVINLPGGVTDDTPIGSAGVGFTYSVTRYLNLDFDYGWQILRLANFTDRNQRGHFSLSFSY